MASQHHESVRTIYACQLPLKKTDILDILQVAAVKTYNDIDSISRAALITYNLNQVLNITKSSVDKLLLLYSLVFYTGSVLTGGAQSLLLHDIKSCIFLCLAQELTRNFDSNGSMMQTMSLMKTLVSLTAFVGAINIYDTLTDHPLNKTVDQIIKEK
ncbi:MAG TPA: hypothetical protein VGW78_06955 [Candidatus Babeliales bacterium]|jgi:hypothetical protein|nr:hypothetical protein [Candidatus Babeliales bacterium]